MGGSGDALFDEVDHQGGSVMERLGSANDGLNKKKGKNGNNGTRASAGLRPRGDRPPTTKPTRRAAAVVALRAIERKVDFSGRVR